MKFRRIYWLLLALTFFALSLLNVYIENFSQYAVFFNMLFAFLFFAIFFLTKKRPETDKKEEPTQTPTNEKAKI